MINHAVEYLTPTYCNYCATKEVLRTLLAARNDKINIGDMKEVLSALGSLSEGEKFCYQKIADRYDVNRFTLSRRHRGVQGLMEDHAINLQLFSPQQEEELVKYVIELTERGLPPTKEIIQSFAHEMVKKEVGEGWLLRFVERNKDALITK
jgi:hypothetical protein